MKHYLPNSLRALFLSLAVLLSLPMLAVDIDGIEYWLGFKTNQAAVSGVFWGYSGDIVIPETVEYEGTTYSVTRIMEQAFYGCSDLTSITIPSSLTSIGKEAFYDCYSLTSLYLSDIAAWCNVTFEGIDMSSRPMRYAKHVYINGEEPKDLLIPDNVTSIGEQVFYNWSCLTSVTIPNSVTSIGGAAFSGCSGLTSVTIGNSVESIGDWAFSGCSGLTSVTIPNSVTSIGGAAFSGCSGLTSITIPNSVTSIGASAFYDCIGLTSVTIGNSVKSIEEGAFYGCTSLKSITIPNSVESIKDEAFSGCSSLASLTIGNGVKSLMSFAFEGCSGLTSIVVEDGNPVLDSRNNCNAIIATATNALLRGCENTVIPNSVTSIVGGAFESCSGLTSVTIPNSVTRIYGQSFQNCSNLLDVYCYAENVPYTDDNAFRESPIENATLHVPNASINSYEATAPWSSFKNIVAITTEVDGINYDFNAGTKQATVIAKSSGKYSDEVVIPESVKYEGTTYSVTSIGDWAFNSCTGLTSVTIPNSVTSIGGKAFDYCSGLTSVTIGNSVTSIGDYAFENCFGLTSVTIPNSVKSIEEGAFFGCTGLTSVTIPNSVTSIGWSAFQSCSGLTSVTIGNGVESIGKTAFSECSGLTSVNIGNSVTSIGERAFSGCSELLNVYCYAENVPSTESNVFNGIDGGKATLYVPAASIDSYKAKSPWSSFGKIVAISTEVDGINYDFNAEAKQATVIAKSSGKYSGEVVIPESVVYESAAYSVTSIGENAFEECTGLTSVTIGNSVTSIGEEAFDGCSGLTSVTIPNSVTSIGEHAFYGCEGLTSVHISDIAAWCNIDFEYYFSNPLYYAHHLYLNGEEVKDLVIPNSVESIGYGTFIHCSGLTSVTIPNSVTSIGRGAFLGCPDLTSVTIPNSVTSIGQSAFDDCRALTSMTIPNSVTSIGRCAFYYCTSLTSVIIGNSVTSIGDYAFNGCSGLTSVTIPNSVESIGYGAFLSCSGLTSVTIGSGVKTIGSKIFDNCQKVLDVYCYAEKVPSTESDAFDVSNYRNATLYVPAASINSYKAKAPWSAFGTIVAISTEVDGINYDFNAEAKQATVIAKSSGTYSGEVIIPESVVYGGIAYSVTSIGEDAFEECTGLASVTIPNSVTSIGEYAFVSCSGLTSVTIPNSVTSIGNGAFSECSGLTSVTIPNSVTSIGEYAFNACSGLTSVTIPNSVQSIGRGAFWCCSGLTSVTIPNSVTSIGNGAFQDCDGLTSVTIPNSVTSIGNYVFDGCSGLTSIVVEEGNTVYDSRNNCNAIIETASNSLICGCNTSIIPNGVESIGDDAFINCSGLSSVTIPNSVTSIGEGAFYGCSGLTSVTIPNSVTSIGSSAFAYCSGLTSVTIPNSVTSIGEGAFYGCPDLLDVYCYAENVPSTESDAFDSRLIEDATLHVPAASINSYEAKAPWSGFGKIVAISESTSDLVIKDGESFENTEERELGTLTYTRTLPNRYWNPLYVPFKIPYEALKDNYDVAYINSMHSYDNDQNGEIDKMTMEVILVKNGVLKANHPYLIRAKSDNAKKMELVLEDVTLYPTVSNKLDCSSVYTHFEITGTYKRMTRDDLDGSLVITTSGAWMELSESSELKPFRFYLTITDRPGSPLEVSKESKSRINICVQGEDDFSTGIEETEIGKVKSENSAVYDLSGRRVQKAQKGIYIHNGKVMVK